MYLRQNISVCQNENNKLSKIIKANQTKYEKRVNELLKIANKPVKIIKIPRIVYKEVKITPKECKQICLMIDDFLKRK